MRHAWHSTVSHLRRPVRGSRLPVLAHALASQASRRAAQRALHLATACSRWCRSRSTPGCCTAVFAPERHLSWAWARVSVDRLAVDADLLGRQLRLPAGGPAGARPAGRRRRAGAAARCSARRCTACRTPSCPRSSAHLVISMLAYSLFTIATLHALLMARAREVAAWRGAAGVPAVAAAAAHDGGAAVPHHRRRLRAAHADPRQRHVLLRGAVRQAAAASPTRRCSAIFVVVHLRRPARGPQLYGWRGRIAVRWTLAGFLALVLAYIGSKFVLEVMLQVARPELSLRRGRASITAGSYPSTLPSSRALDDIPLHTLLIALVVLLLVSAFLLDRRDQHDGAQPLPAEATSRRPATAARASRAAARAHRQAARRDPARQQPRQRRGRRAWHRDRVSRCSAKASSAVIDRHRAR